MDAAGAVALSIVSSLHVEALYVDAAGTMDARPC
jgi:hypothetical protein